ncbi:hypothetical protein AVEN_201873-1 [Araneus ventricosus]|uniref:Integrase zinc-binding domain-containing protein n=1 Tax=Araneus ventricosus TaxID=182803 RepID=A0A4Y2IYA9_ARAVE|nr:hypothetical protein AVEN_201873-1 [Araneus ventricosus]
MERLRKLLAEVETDEDPDFDNENNSIIRVGGRISYVQSLTLDQKHPMLLPSRHIVTRLLIRSFHERHFHAGPLLGLSLRRQKYWFVNGRPNVNQ